MPFTDSLTVYRKSVPELRKIAFDILTSVSDDLNKKLNFTSLKSFIREVSDFYFHNPYHNFTHAVEVIMFTKALVIVLEEKSFSHYSDNDKFFLFVSSLCHDILHTGLSNLSLMSKYPMAIISLKSPSINEKLSINKCLELTRKHSIFINFTIEEREEFKSLLFRSILNTDITIDSFEERLKEVFSVDIPTVKIEDCSESFLKKGFKDFKQVKSVVKETKASASADFDDLDENEDINDKEAIKRKTLEKEERKKMKKWIRFSFLLRLADVSNCLISPKSCINGAFRLYCEWNRKEIHKEICEETVRNSLKSQDGFFKGYVEPLLVKSLFYRAISKEVFLELKKNLDGIKKFLKGLEVERSQGVGGGINVMDLVEIPKLHNYYV